MLDTSRNYFPVGVIKRQLDAMSWVKVHSAHLISVANADQNHYSKILSIGTS